MSASPTVRTRFVGVREACSVLGLSRTATYNLVAAGELRTVRFGRRRLIPVAELERFADLLEAQAS